MSAATHILANGAIVAADTVPGVETIAVGVSFNAGARDEIAAENGLAHLLEHMAFKGTHSRSARAIAEAIEGVGGWLNASTGYQRTSYYARVLARDLDRAFDVLADILYNALYDSDALEKERRIVAQEIAEAHDNPEDHVYTLLQETCFPNQSLGRPILGVLETLDALDADAFLRFMAARYRPENMVVAVAGGIAPDAVFQAAERHFGARSGGESDFGAAVRTPARFASGVRFDRRTIEQSHVALALRGEEVGAPGLYAMRVFAEILGGGMASRLFQTIREERGLAYSVYAFAEAYDDVGLIDIYAGTEDRSAPAAIAAALRCVSDMTERVTASELERAKAILKASVLMGLETPLGRVEAMTHQLYTEKRLLGAEALCARIDAVTSDGVREAAETALSGPIALSAVGQADAEALQQAVANVGGDA
ncbi:MAG: pitrilysin family protein [Pseudomonadota bacterium]